MSLLAQALVYLLATVVAVPISRRLGLGSVLGYLAAGIVIGPWGFELIADVESVLRFSELGIVLFLFLIGLELQPSRLWELRHPVFALGGLQVGITTLVLGGIALGAGLHWNTALVVGVGLSLSSTAFALQLLAERKELTTEHGRASFGILLFQDLAVIPVLAALPFLGMRAGEPAAPSWTAVLKVVVVLAAVVVGGRFVIRPVFRFVASIQSQEVFTATALLIVIGTAALLNAVGLSMALGAFLAGVLLADSEYRHELEADLEPFKGLLLGLFFVAVGMSVHITLLTERPLLVVSLVLGLVVLKGAVLVAIGRAAFRNNESALSMAVAISQGGEFAFVVFALATGGSILDRATADLLVLVVGLSMAVTPLFFLLFDKWVKPRFRAGARRAFDVSPTREAPVIIAGFGRVGQVVGRVLRARRIPFTAMDASAEHIDFLTKYGTKVFYGDAARLDLLRTARADQAKIFVLAVDDVEASLRIAQTVKDNFPNLIIFARARNRQHAYRLLELGIEHIMRETWLSSIDMTAEILEALGIPWSEARSIMERFREFDEKLLRENFKYLRDEAKLRELAVQSREELEKLFAQDAAPPNRAG